MSSIKSAELLRLIGTRAQIVAMAADPRVSTTAVAVGSLLWAITETWDLNERKQVSYGQVAQQMVSSGPGAQPKPLSEQTIKRAVAELEEAGYIVVNRDACTGRGKAPTVEMKRRTVGAAHTMQASGPFRVWTKDQMDEVEDEAQVDGCGDGQEGDRPRPPSDLKGVAHDPLLDERGSPMTPIDEKGGHPRPPLKETYYKKATFQEADLESLPPLAGGSAPALGESLPVEAEGTPWGEVHEPVADQGEEKDTWTWEEVGSASDLTLMLVQVAQGDAVQDLTIRKQREVEKGLVSLLEAFPLEAVVWGLGAWAGDRRMSNANLLEEIAARHIVAWDPDLADLRANYTPTQVLAGGYRCGEEHRKDRLRRAG